jgi:hypothetical protein
LSQGFSEEENKMGGRGRSATHGTRQYTFQDELLKQEIQDKRLKNAKKSASLVANGGINSEFAITLKKCKCCGESTLFRGTIYEVCSVCGWIDDPYQNLHPDSEEGKNSISLSQARKDFLAKQKAQ